MMLTPEQRIVRNVLESSGKGNGFVTIRCRQIRDGVLLIDALALRVCQLEADRTALRAALEEQRYAPTGVDD